MKRKIALLFSLVFIFSVSFAQDTLRWNRANLDYSEGDFRSAISDYEAMIAEGENSWEVLYNLGAAYYKDGQIGLAILNTERAGRINPSNDDIEHNLKVLYAQTKDRIEPLPEFFLIDWTKSVRDSLSPNSWTTILIVFFALMVCCFVLWFTMRRGKFRILAYAFGFFALCSYGFAHSAYSRIEGGNDAIVINTASVVRSSPDSNGKELFVLHSGTKVEKVDEFGLYTEVVIASGNKGWIATKDIEEI